MTQAAMHPTAENRPTTDAVLDVRGLRVVYRSSDRDAVAVDDVSFSVGQGEMLGIVGESGCGKSTIALSLLGLIPRSAAAITARRMAIRERDSDRWTNLLGAGDRVMRSVRGAQIGLVMQEPAGALNPVLPVGRQIAEAIRAHRMVGRAEARALAVRSLEDAGLPDARRCGEAYAHELSGGMRQRACIAMALAVEPVLLIADEPTSALDVTVQAQVLDLLERLRDEKRIGVVLISHNLPMVAERADRVCVMYAGRIVESGPAQRVFERPSHPYTEALIRCAPRLGEQRRRLEAIPGAVAPATDWPVGCRFHPRCELSAQIAASTDREGTIVAGRRVLRSCTQPRAHEPAGPVLVEIEEGHRVACWERVPR